MSPTKQTESVSPFQAAYWKSQHEKQRLVVESIMSLLAKYGSSLELDLLYREYLLTVMGQCLAVDSCYYAKDETRGVYSPAKVYGKVDAAALPTFNMDSKLVNYLEEHPFPSPASNLPDALSPGNEMQTLKTHFAVVSPLVLKKLLGIAFLGRKISSQPYTDSEMSLLHSFSIVSAMTFNHAALFRNAKLSIAELNKLNTIRTEIISRITHEFRTPLTVIKGGLTALRLEGEQAEVVQWIKDSVTRLEDLISSLLDLNDSCLEDTIISLNDWDAAKVLQEAVIFHTEVAADRNISLEITEVSPGSIPQLKITAERFRLVLNNLIDNAIKFSDHSAVVSLGFEHGLRGPRTESDGIRLPNWKEQFKQRINEYGAEAGSDFLEEMLSAPDGFETGPDSDPEPDQRFVVFKITDGGIGIPVEEITSLSEPFQQASNSPNLRVKGKGLGLSVSQRIISRRGGHIYCRSEQGRGTTFTVFLPLR